MSFTVAIVGRPNVGKSTLFNRLVGRRMALVDDTPGVTRDRREGSAHLGDLDFKVIDTAGLEQADRQSLAGRMAEQSERAVRHSDLALLLIDARTGVTPADRHFAQSLRRLGRPVVLVANKCENTRAAEPAIGEAFELGLGEAVAISAEHGEGMGELRDAIAAIMPQGGSAVVAAEPQPALLKLAVLGRPNVGKSTLINALIGEERLLTSTEAGTTRDSIAVNWTHKGRALRLFDTAGLRRRARVEAKLERLSNADALRAMRFAEVVILVIDAQQMLEKQDLAIARLVIEEGRAMVLAVNKWDLVEDRTTATKVLRQRIDLSLPQVKGIAAVPVSALTGQRLDRLIDAAIAAHEIWNKKLATPALNRWLQQAVAAHSPPLVAGRRLKPRYITQIGARPPSFALFLNKATELPEDYRRYLVNDLRQTFDLPGTPIRFELRQGRNPFAGKRR